VPVRTRLASLYRTLFRASRLDRDLDAELDAYVDGLVEQHCRAGMSPVEARRAALVQLGGRDQVKEAVRSARIGYGVDTWLQDVRYALRGLTRAPGFTLVTVLTLALGIGANTAIFSVVDGVLLRPVPVRDLSRLVMLWETDRRSGTSREPASVPDYLDFQARSSTLSAIGALAAGEVNLTPPGGEPVRLAALRVTPELLPILGVAPIRGRQFSQVNGRPNGGNVALVSASLWKRVFAGERTAIGRTLQLNDVAFEVIGVVADTTDFGVLQILSRAAYGRAFADRGERVRIDVWLPLQETPESSPRETHPIFLVGRLAVGQTARAASEELGTIAADLERTYPSNAGRGVNVEPFDDVVFSRVRPVLGILLGAVGLVLLVACVNVATLLLARGWLRRGEVAVRVAMGAGTGRLTTQFVVEGLVLTLIGAAAGLVVAYAGLAVLLALAPAEVPRLTAVTIDGRVLAATLAVAALVGLGFGLVPVAQARRVDVGEALKGGAGRDGVRGPARARVRAVLVVTEIALAVLLVAVAGLLLKSFWRLHQVDPGFRAEQVLKAEFQLPASRYPRPMRQWPVFPAAHTFTERLLERAKALPGVTAAAVAGNHPLDAGFTNSFVIVGREAEAESQPEISVRRVSPGYFPTVGLALVRGRLFRQSDSTDAAPVLLINEAAEHRFFPRGNAVGSQIRFWGAARTIVGVVANERFHGLSEGPPIAAYAPLSQAPSVDGTGVLLVRTTGDPAVLAPAVRRIVRDLDPGLAVFGIEPFVQTVSRSIAERRFTLVLLAAFAAVALLLAAVGIHGLLSYAVSGRTREIGVRLALGARPSSIMRLMLGEGLLLAAAGLAVGLAGAVASGRLLEGLLYGVGPHDTATLAAVAALLAGVAAMASYLPARRATKIDPTTALRTE
jgi:predicted permease